MKNEIINVFISHIHEDDSKLADLKGLLEKEGISARDYSINADKPNRAKSEEYIKSQILAPQIKQCSVLVVYISEGTQNSDYVNWEIDYAHKLEKRIVGIWGQGEEGCKIPEELENYRDALSDWNAEDIIKAIKGNNSIQKNIDGSSRPLRKITRHPCH